MGRRLPPAHVRTTLETCDFHPPSFVLLVPLRTDEILLMVQKFGGFSARIKKPKGNSGGVSDFILLMAEILHQWRLQVGSLSPLFTKVYTFQGVFFIAKLRSHMPPRCDREVGAKVVSMMWSWWVEHDLEYWLLNDNDWMIPWWMTKKNTHFSRMMMMMMMMVMMRMVMAKMGPPWATGYRYHHWPPKIQYTKVWSHNCLLYWLWRCQCLSLLDLQAHAKHCAQSQQNEACSQLLQLMIKSHPVGCSARGRVLAVGGSL